MDEVVFFCVDRVVARDVVVGNVRFAGSEIVRNGVEGRDDSVHGMTHKVPGVAIVQIGGVIVEEQLIAG